MAEIRVERKARSNAWLWIVLAVVLLILAAVVLDRLGYVNLFAMSTTGAAPLPHAVWTAV